MAVRSKIHGTADKPRVSVYRSNKHVQLQVIDDDEGVTLFSTTDMDKDKKGTKTERAIAAAKELAKKLKSKKIKTIIYDRGPYHYQGRVKAIAETLREAGIEF